MIKEYSEHFFTLDVNYDKTVIIMNLNEKGIICFYESIEQINHKTIIDETNILKIEPMKDFIPIVKMIIDISLPNIYESDFVINYSNDGDLYFFTNRLGIAALKMELDFLKNKLQQGEPEHTYLMVDEWGGGGLKNVQLVNDSNVICQLRIIAR